MQQEIRVTVQLTYSAEARLSAEELRAQIIEDLNRLADADSESKVQMENGTIIRLEEEAAIFGTD